MISLGIDELPPDPGELCTCCQQIIIGLKYSVYIQVGEAEEANYAAHLCRECKVIKLGED